MYNTKNIIIFWENMKIKNYQELIIWKKSIDLVIELYKITKNFPKEEVYGLISQIRRAAVSVPSNIADERLKYIDQITASNISEELCEIGKMINVLIKKINDTL
jgi:hypothetical protein